MLSEECRLPRLSRDFWTSSHHIASQPDLVGTVYDHCSSCSYRIPVNIKHIYHTVAGFHQALGQVPSCGEETSNTTILVLLISSYLELAPIGRS